MTGDQIELFALAGAENRGLHQIRYYGVSCW